LEKLSPGIKNPFGKYYPNPKLMDPLLIWVPKGPKITPVGITPKGARELPKALN